MIAQSPAPILPLDGLVSVSLFVPVVPQQGDILITTEFGKTMVEPNEICVIQVRMLTIHPVLTQMTTILFALTPFFPSYLERYCVLVFQRDRGIMNNNSGKRVWVIACIFTTKISFHHL